MNANTPATSTLIAHKGSRIVPLEYVERVKTPAATSTWFPVGHGAVISSVRQSLVDAGFRIVKGQYALSPTDGQFFGTLDLASGMADGVTLAVGVRNSIDKTLPLGFCAGSRVFVCDNLSFGADLIVKKKHTKFGDDRFREAIAQAVVGLAQYQQAETVRVKVLQATDATDKAAESVILRSWEQGVLTNHTLPLVLKEWRKPSFAEFEPRTAWSLFNAYTTALGRTRMNQQTYADRTIQLTGLIGREFGVADAMPPALAA